MKTTRIYIVLLSIVSITIVGCSRFSTQQKDESYDSEGRPMRAISTKASAYTFFSGKSALTQFKASQTDKTQGATVGNLTQDGGQTNQVSDIVKAVTEGAVAGAIRATK